MSSSSSASTPARDQSVAAFVYEQSLVTISSLHNPTRGALMASSNARAIEGIILKRGAKVKSWKQRFAVLSTNARTLYYFKEGKSPSDLPLGYVELWDVQVRSYDVGSRGTTSTTPKSPRWKGETANYSLCLTGPFKREFWMAFTSEKERDDWKAAIVRVRSAGRAADAKPTHQWWKDNLGPEDEYVSWTSFVRALARSHLYNLELAVEASLCFVLTSIRRAETRALSLDQVGLAELVEFTYLFGDLSEALQTFDGVLHSLNICSMNYAEQALNNAAVGTFVLYVAARATAETLAVFGLAFVKQPRKVHHVHVFRDPVSKRFYTSYDTPAFQRLDHLVADLIGVTPIFGRETQLKLAEVDQIGRMIKMGREDASRSGGGVSPRDRRVLERRGLASTKVKAVPSSSTTSLSKSTGSIAMASAQPAPSLSTSATGIGVSGGKKGPGKTGDAVTPKSQSPPTLHRVPTGGGTVTPMFDDIERMLGDAERGSTNKPQTRESVATAFAEIVPPLPRFSLLNDEDEESGVLHTWGEGDDNGRVSHVRVSEMRPHSGSYDTNTHSLDRPLQFIRKDSLSETEARNLTAKEEERKRVLVGLREQVKAWNRDWQDESGLG